VLWIAEHDRIGDRVTAVGAKAQRLFAERRLEDAPVDQLDVLDPQLLVPVALQRRQRRDPAQLLRDPLPGPRRAQARRLVIIRAGSLPESREGSLNRRNRRLGQAALLRIECGERSGEAILSHSPPL
jgi:hypothetical protein